MKEKRTSHHVGRRRRVDGTVVKGRTTTTAVAWTTNKKGEDDGTNTERQLVVTTPAVAAAVTDTSYTNSQDIQLSLSRRRRSPASSPWRSPRIQRSPCGGSGVGVQSKDERGGTEEEEGGGEPRQDPTSIPLARVVLFLTLRLLCYR